MKKWFIGCSLFALVVGKVDRSFLPVAVAASNAIVSRSPFLR